jgi:hypothetical protein
MLKERFGADIAAALGWAQRLLLPAMRTQEPGPTL